MGNSERIFFLPSFVGKLRVRTHRLLDHLTYLCMLYGCPSLRDELCFFFALQQDLSVQLSMQIPMNFAGSPSLVLQLISQNTKNMFSPAWLVIADIDCVCVLHGVILVFNCVRNTSL